jgi:phenylacetate-CoA ligase
MNPLLNPTITLPFIKNYFQDQVRLDRLTTPQLHRYQDKALRKIITYADTVPLYHNTYTNAHITPNDITSIADLTKHPFITKQDLRDNFPDNIIPKNYNKKQTYMVCTGGSSGKSVYIYTDFRTFLRAMGPTLYQMHYFHLNLRTIKLAHVGNFSQYRNDQVLEDGFFPALRSVYSGKNSLNIDVNQPIHEIMQKLDAFQPDLIMSYPALFQHLAFLKRKGFGEHLHPKLLHVGGDILDNYTRRYVEDAFNCRLLNIYPAVEAQSSMAFECYEGNWHTHADFYHFEAIDKDNTPVAPGERGHLVLTRLWGWGTPIIRYTGIDDFITLADENDRCSCGMHGPILKKPIEGRLRTNIVLPNGKVFPPGAFCFVEPVLHDLHTFKVKQYQVIQQSTHEVEILLAIDEDLRMVGPPVTQIMDGIKKVYQDKCGPEVTVTIREVPEIKGDLKSGKPAPIVISKVTREEGYKQLDR